MQQTTHPIDENIDDQKSYGGVLREIGSSLKDVAKSELQLVVAEYKKAMPDFSRHVAQGVIFGALLAVSVLPLLAFFVIGLGELLGGRYWLSSLIVAVVCAAVGGTFAYRAYRKLKNEDMRFTHTRHGIDETIKTTQQKLEQVKEAISQ